MKATRSREDFGTPSVHVNMFLPEDMARRVEKYREDRNKSAAYRKVLEAGLKALAEQNA